ncbi:uncharacterized protein LOC127701609 [Mytilus californianus]|uniref:uncharacterized protein LOC127701609 n=1 Tax=Mytilus californianus TaxID=6549 RepID=UPI002248270D|nr:uncharacterized protein LOC127701609 [Mytilus californianus]
MNMIIGLATLLLVSVGAVPEVNHLVEIDHQGHTVAMDVIHDSKDKTVLAIVGDVSKYKNGIQTVNFHDYNTGYGALKDINKQTCVITKSPVPMGTDKQYRVGITTEVHDHILSLVPRKLTYEDVRTLAGPKVAAFCKDYTSLYADITPANKQRRAADDAGSSMSYMWCVISTCFVNTAALDSAIGK